jgi:hypothetical protein
MHEVEVLRKIKHYYLMSVSHFSRAASIEKGPWTHYAFLLSLYTLTTVQIRGSRRGAGNI